MGRTQGVVLALGLVLSAGLFAFDRVTQPALRRRAELDQAVRASALAVRLESHLAAAKQTARTLAALAATVRSSEDTEGLLRRVVGSTSHDYVYGAGLWFEPDALEPGRRHVGPYAHRPRDGGPGVEFTYEWSTPEYDYHSRDWYRAGLAARGEPAFTEPYFDVDFVYRTVALPIPDERGGPPRGVATVGVTLPLLRRLVDEANTSPHEVLYAVTPEGRLFAHPEERALLARAQALGRPAQHLSDLHLEDLRAHEHERGHDRARHTHAAAVTGSGWRVFAATDRAHLYAEARRARAGTLALGGLLWLLLGASAWATHRTRHARRLQAALEDHRRLLEEREHARQLLAASEARLRQVLESALDAVVAVDAAGRVTEWNGCAAALTGWPAEEALGRPAVELLVPEGERAAAAARLGEVLREPGWRRRAEAVVVHRDGHRVPLEASFVVVQATGADGEVERLLFVFAEDATERRRLDAERLRLLAELRQRTGELTGVMDALQEAVLVADATGRVTVANAAAQHMMDLRRPGAAAMTPDLPRTQGILLPSGLPAPLERLPLYRALRGERVAGADLLRAPPDAPGPPRVLRTNAAPIYDPSGRVVGATAVTLDVTAQLEAERTRDALAQGAAQALEAALAAVRAPPDAAAAGDAARAVERLERALGDLRDAAALARGELALAQEPVDLAALAREAVAALQAGGRPARLRAPATAVPVRGDPARLRRVLDVLLARAAAADGPVEVALEAGTGGVVELRVSAPGAGTPAPDALELALVRGLVQGHGGHLVLEEHGAGARVRLPGAPAADGGGRDAPAALR